MVPFYDEAGRGHVVAMQFSNDPDEIVAKLLAIDVAEISMILFEEWPGLLFDAEMFPTKNENWKLAIFGSKVHARRTTGTSAEIFG